MGSLHGAGIICVPMAGAVGRYDDFYTSLERLEIPAVVEGAINSKGICKVASSNVANALNFACLSCVNDPAREWVWFLGDDHTFDPGLLIRLLDRQVDVVVPLVSERHPPYQTVAFKGLHGARYAWCELPTSGLLPLPIGHVIGQAGMLVRRSVLQKLESPWFRIGQYDPSSLREDIYFSESLHRAGVTIHVDCAEIMGHLQVFDIRPARDPDTGFWRPAITTGGDVPSWAWAQIKGPA